MTSYGLQCAIALAALLLFAGAWCRSHHVRAGYRVWITLCVMAIPLALIGSRLLFGLTSLGIGDMTSPVQILYAWDGGASMAGAFAGVVLAAFLTEKLCKVPHGNLLDGVALGAPLALIIARLAEGPVGMSAGRQVDTAFLQWLGEATDGCHPVFLYEALWAFLTCILVVRHIPRASRRGDLLLTFMVLYGSAQMFFESLRDDMHMVIYYIRINQLTALAMVLIPFIIYLVRFAKKQQSWKAILLPCAVMAVSIVLCIYQEFQVDSNPNLLKEYALMAAGVAVMGAQTLYLRHKAA